MTESHVAAHDRARRLLLSHRAVPGELRSIRRLVQRWAGLWDLPDDAVTDLQLAVGEAVANGVEHAYRDARPGTVEVELTLQGSSGSAADGAVLVQVVDHGRWQPAPRERGHRGHGLTMIRRLTRHLEVVRSAHGTRVLFEVPLSGMSLSGVPWPAG